MHIHDGMSRPKETPQLRQKRKIREIGDALITEGLRTLDKQSAALGLVRSTAWSIFQAKQKRGITTATLLRMLKSPHLPQTVRQKVVEYAAEKAAGLYGHKGRYLREFKGQFDSYILSHVNMDQRRDFPTEPQI